MIFTTQRDEDWSSNVKTSNYTLLRAILLLLGYTEFHKKSDRFNTTQVSETNMVEM